MQTSAKDVKLVALDKMCSYYMIDVIKFICCFMVLTIHIAPFPADSFSMAKYFNFGLQKYLCRLAVPFFFACSGFFLFRKMGGLQVQWDTVKAYCWKMVRLLGIWSIVLASTETYHLWYLGGAVVAILLLCLLLRFRIKPVMMVMMALSLYVIGLFGDAYYGVLEPLREFRPFDLAVKGYEYLFANTRNGVFMGFLFVLIGALFASGKIRINTVIAAAGFSISMLCLFAEVFVLQRLDIPKDYNFYVFLVPAVFFLFAFAVNFQSVKEGRTQLLKHLRSTGVLIWMLHLLVYRVIMLSLAALNKCGLDLRSYRYVFTVLGCVAVALCIAWASSKEKMKWLKILYS